MGCVETHSTSEETAVIFAEKGLNFFSRHASRVDTIIRKYSPNGKTNHNQLTRIGEILGIKTFNSPPHDKIEDMLRFLISSDGTYDMKDLLVIGILLAHGEPDLKAGLLYQIFDEDLTNKLPISKINGEVIPKLITHSYKTLPMLVAPGQSVVSNPIKNEKYVNDMGQVHKVCAKIIGDKLAEHGSSITENAFVEVFSTFNQGALTTSTGWRKFLADTYVANPPKKVFANPYKKANK